MWPGEGGEYDVAQTGNVFHPAVAMFIEAKSLRMQGRYSQLSICVFAGCTRPVG